MEENNTKEVNLLQLINLFFNWLKKIGKGLLGFLVYLAQLGFRHKSIIIITCSLGLIVGLYLSRPSVRVYKAEAMGMIYGSEAQTVKEICKQLEISVGSNKLYSLSTKLSLPDSVARNIVGFHSFYVIDYLKDKVADVVDFDNSHSLTDTMSVRMKDRLYFRVLTTNINQFPKIQSAILQYFNNNEIMKNEYANKKNELLKEMQICDIESKRIDSLAKISYFKTTDKQLQFDNNKLLIGEQRKQLFYGELLDLQDRKSKAESKFINYKQPMELPSGFVVYPMPENGSVKYGIISIIIGFVISLVIAGLVENLKKIVAFLNNK